MRSTRVCCGPPEPCVNTELHFLGVKDSHGSPMDREEAVVAKAVNNSGDFQMCCGFRLIKVNTHVHNARRIRRDSERSLRNFRCIKK